MAEALVEALIDLKKHSSLIYAEGVFGLEARKKFPMRSKTADGVLRYANYKITGVIDSTSREHRVGDVLPVYLAGTKNFSVPIFKDIKGATAATHSRVLILGSAPEGGELPKAWRSDIAWALKNKIHIVSGLHYGLNNDAYLRNLARKSRVLIWDTRIGKNCEDFQVASAMAYHIKKPIVLTVGTDAAIGKMTVTYEMHRAAQKLGLKSCVIPTGQTAIMIEGWGAAIDALPADFMAGAVEKMLLENEKKADIFFVEGQGSLFHPAYANTCISLIHGAVPTHMVLVCRPQRKHSIGSKLIKLPDVKTAIEQYEAAVLPSYRNTKVIGVALNSEGLSEKETGDWKKKTSRECGLPVFDALKDTQVITKVVQGII